MWQRAKAASTKNCDYCEHQINAEEICLTEVPELFSITVSPVEYRHFHISCRQCRPSHSCYELYAREAKLENVAECKTALPCGYCEQTIEIGQNLVWDYYSAGGKGNGVLDAGDAKASFIGSLRKGEFTHKFNDLGTDLKTKFARAGLGGKRGVRNYSQAEAFFDTSVPGSVRNLGEKATREFLKGKVASQIRSVKNAPDSAKNPSNIIWESAKNNMRRGSDNMSKMDRLMAKGRNGVRATRISSRIMASSAGKAAGIAAVVEGAVSVSENTIHFAKGKKTGKKAIMDTGKNIAKAGALGGTFGIASTAAVAAGAGSVLAPAMPFIAAAGIGFTGVSAFSRIKRAMRDEDLDFITEWKLNDTLPLFFHFEHQPEHDDISCYELFAASVSSSLPRSE